MKVKKVLTIAVLLLLSLFATKAYGNGGVILQPVQTPATGQTYVRLENVELWLIYSPDSIRHREVKAVIDGKEIALNLKNITFCEAWQMPAEVWAANISLPPGEHACQYFYVQSVKQVDGSWADFNVQTTEPFKFYVVSQGQSPLVSGEPQTQVRNATEFQTLSLDAKTVSFCLLLAAGLGFFVVEIRSRRTNPRRRK